MADALVAVDLGDVAAAVDAAWPHQQSNNATMRMLMRLRGYFAVIVSYLKYVLCSLGETTSTVLASCARVKK